MRALRRGDYVAGGLSLGVIALIVSSRRKEGKSDSKVETPTSGTGRSILLDAATGLLFDTSSRLFSADRVPLPKRDWPIEVARSDPERVSASFLTGEEPSSPERAAIENEVRSAFARMNAYYASTWYPAHFGTTRPAHFGTTRPDIPRTLAIVSQYRSFANQADITAAVIQSLGITPASSDADVRSALLQSLTTRSVPGFSRHHWGTEIDAVSPWASMWKPGARFAPLVSFMTNEAPRFGFYNTYQEGLFPQPTRPHYDSEPWHLSYFPIAARLRERWLAEVNTLALLERVAQALGPVAGVETLRRILPTLDLMSYQENVAPVPSIDARRAPDIARGFDFGALFRQSARGFA